MSEVQVGEMRMRCEGTACQKSGGWQRELSRRAVSEEGGRGGHIHESLDVEQVLLCVVHSRTVRRRRRARSRSN